MLKRTALCHFVRITLFIASIPPPPQAQLSMCCVAYHGKMKTATARSGGTCIMLNTERGCMHASRRSIIGPSLSEPHTSETALHTFVYISMLVCLWPYTVKFKWVHLYLNIWRRSSPCALNAKTTEVEACMHSKKRNVVVIRGYFSMNSWNVWRCS